MKFTTAVKDHRRRRPPIRGEGHRRRRMSELDRRNPGAKEFQSIERERKSTPFLFLFFFIRFTGDRLIVVDVVEQFPRMNEEFEIDDIAEDQCVLSWINATLSDKVLASVYGITSAREVWSSLANKFASQSRTHVHHLKRKLQTLHQGSMKCTDFLEKAKLVSDEVVAVGKPLEDDDLMSYIVSGLHPSFNPFITSLSFATRDKNVSFEDFQAELLSYELLLENQNTSILPETNNFAFFTPKSNQQQYNRKPKNSSKPYSRPSYSQNPRPQYSPHPRPQYSPKPSGLPSSPQPNQMQYSFFTPKSPCQICGKLSHKALDCFHRMDYAYQGRHPPTQLAAMVAHTNAEQEEETWFADSGANQHITANLEHLTLQQPYTGQENVAVGNGQGLSIAHTGTAIFHTPEAKLNLKCVLHCPQASTNLLSINHFCLDNNCFFILTGTHYFVKDMQTGATLLEGRSEGGLYPIHLQSMSINKSHALAAVVGIKAPVSVWHSRLGHASLPIVSHSTYGNHLNSTTGFIAKIIHSSHFYQPNMTEYNWAKVALEQSKEHISYYAQQRSQKGIFIPMAASRYAYLMSITIGYSEKKFHLIADTGSSLTWIHCATSKQPKVGRNCEFGVIYGNGGEQIFGEVGWEMFRFSYCFFPKTSGYIRFGSYAEIMGRTTPMLQVPGSNHFYLYLEGISVGSSRLHLRRGIFNVSKNGNGGFIIDSGTTMIVIEPDAFWPLREALEQQSKLPILDDPDSKFEMCFSGTKIDAEAMPYIIFHFSGVNFTIPAHVAFKPIDKQTFCSIFEETSSYGIVKVAAGSSLYSHNASDLDWLRELGLVRGDTAVTAFSHPALCLNRGGLRNGTFHEFECSEADAQHMLQVWEDTTGIDPAFGYKHRPVKCPSFRRIAPDPQEKNFGCWTVSSLLSYPGRVNDDMIT
ncbi:hypothetical protein HHK36_020061 [Tetracentron sinense]|uniref:Peptidase A1 domain-containing protein n=1 Tax=Tetracentron sinense TaxID=13715 RepID=A0A834YWN6_TETSI|nr:hypothetical protein HHK36_020061 [Tetracentron sinense]